MWRKAVVIKLAPPPPKPIEKKVRFEDHSEPGLGSRPKRMPVSARPQTPRHRSSSTDLPPSTNAPSMASTGDPSAKDKLLTTVMILPSSSPFSSSPFLSKLSIVAPTSQANLSRPPSVKPNSFTLNTELIPTSGPSRTAARKPAPRAFGAHFTVGEAPFSLPGSQKSTASPMLPPRITVVRTALTKPEARSALPTPSLTPTPTLPPPFKLLRAPSLTSSASLSSTTSSCAKFTSSSGTRDSPIIIDLDSDDDESGHELISRQQFRDVLTSTTATLKDQVKAKMRNPLPTPPRSTSPSVRHMTSRSGSPPDAPYMVALIEGKGQGLVAVKPIKRGDLIFREAPMFTIDLDRVDQEITYDDIHPSYQLLTPFERATLRSFHGRNDKNAERDELVNIVETNCIPLVDHHNDDGFVEGGVDVGDETQTARPYSTYRSKRNSAELGLFKTICRTNHSCIPNAVWKWYAEERTMHLYAYTEIPQGAEITVSYLPEPARPTLERQKALREGYGFVCRCSSCSRSPQERLRPDRDLQMYQSIRSRWIKTPVDKYARNLPKALRDIDLALDIVEQQEQWEERGEIYSVLYEVYALHGKHEEAKEAAQKALAHYTVTCGQSKAEKMSFDAQARDPTLYAKWGYLKTRKAVVKDEEEASQAEEGSSQESTDSMLSGEGGQRKRNRRWSIDKKPEWWQDGPYQPKKRR